MSSYDQPQEFISMDEYRDTMRLVRLQIAVPTSVLVALGTFLVCTLGVKPGLGEISNEFPTLLTPNNAIVAGYLAVFFLFENGMCLLLTAARGQHTKEAFVHGVGLRMAVANWLLAFWAVCWNLKWFLPAAILAAVNLLNVLSIVWTLRPFPVVRGHPLTAMFVTTPVSLLLALLVALGLHNGAVALNWVIDPREPTDHWVLPAVASLAGVHVLFALWEIQVLDVVLAAANEALLLALLLSPTGVRVSASATAALKPKHPHDPHDPEDRSPAKPPALMAVIITALVLHPFAVLVGYIVQRRRNALGRIRLEEEVEAADQRVRQAEAEAEEARAAMGRRD